MAHFFLSHWVICSVVVAVGVLAVVVAWSACALAGAADALCDLWAPDYDSH